MFVSRQNLFFDLDNLQNLVAFKILHFFAVVFCVIMWVNGWLWDHCKELWATVKLLEKLYKCRMFTINLLRWRNPARLAKVSKRVRGFSLNFFWLFCQFILRMWNFQKCLVNHNFDSELVCNILYHYTFHTLFSAVIDCLQCAVVAGFKKRQTLLLLLHPLFFTFSRWQWRQW